MLFKSRYVVVFNLQQLTTHILTLTMWHNRFRQNENEASEAHIPRHRDSKTKIHDIEIPRLKNQDIEIPRLKSHDIEFPRNSDLYAP